MNYNQTSNSYYKRESDKDAIINLLQKENMALKAVLKEKRIDNTTFNSLLAVLDLQREQINFLEEELDMEYKRSHDLKEAMKMQELRPKTKASQDQEKEFFAKLNEKYNSEYLGEINKGQNQMGQKDSKDFSRYEMGSNNEYKYYKKTSNTGVDGDPSSKKNLMPIKNSHNSNTSLSDVNVSRSISVSNTPNINKSNKFNM